MKGVLKNKWQEFKHGQPGRRFQARYQQKRQTRQNRPWYKVVLKAFLAVALILVGIVFAFIPGPAVLFFGIAAVLLADQSRTIARLLDWTEVKLRKIFAWAMAWWRRSSIPLKGAAILLGMLGGALAGYLGYQLLAD